MDIEKIVVETNDGKFFAAFVQSFPVTWSWQCTLCGKKVSTSGKMGWIDKLYNHWRFAHTTKFTIFAIGTASSKENWKMSWGGKESDIYYVGAPIR